MERDRNETQKFAAIIVLMDKNGLTERKIAQRISNDGENEGLREGPVRVYERLLNRLPKSYESG